MSRFAAAFFLSMFAFACSSPSHVDSGDENATVEATTALPSCPDDPNWAYHPLYPDAQRVPGKSMASTLAPGQNSSVDTYTVDGVPSEQVLEFYEQCLGQTARASDLGWVFELPKPSMGEKSLLVNPNTTPLELVLYCEGC